MCMSSKRPSHKVGRLLEQKRVEGRCTRKLASRITDRCEHRGTSWRYGWCSCWSRLISLLYPDPINLHDLTISPEGLFIDTFLSSPITANSHVEDHVELVIERPYRLVGVRFFPEDLVHRVVASKEDDIWPPLDGVRV